MPTPEYQPIPADLAAEARTSDDSPCYRLPKTEYVVMLTNMFGPLQLHTCGCGSVFVFSETYGWLAISSKDLVGRIKDAVRQAKAENRPGWSKPYWRGWV